MAMDFAFKLKITGWLCVECSKQGNAICELRWERGFGDIWRLNGEKRRGLGVDALVVVSADVKTSATVLQI